jgi:hypothetical protein
MLTRMLGNRVENKQTARESTELRPNMAGEVSVEELFFMRLTTMRFRQNWLQREVSGSLTASVMLVIGAAGFILGFLSSRLVDSSGNLSVLGDGGRLSLCWPVDIAVQLSQ